MRNYRFRLVACLMPAIFAGCSGFQPRELAWPALPSPWATVKSSPPRSALAQDGAGDSGSQKKPSPTAKSKANKSKPDDSVVLAILNGMNFERSGDWKQAREVYEEVRKKQPDNVEAMHRLGIVADAQRRHAEAEQLFLAALEQQPRNAELLADLGFCYYLQGQLAKAESALGKATKLNPKESRYWNNLGLAIGHQGRYEEALDCFRKTGSEADAQYNLAFIFAGQDRVAEAKRSFHTALANDPTHRRAREALASFEEYERLPKDLRDVDDLAADGVRYVPFIENANNSGTGEVASTSFTASRTARALHGESRGMLGRNMASQRSDEMVRE